MAALSAPSFQNPAVLSFIGKFFDHKYKFIVQSATVGVVCQMPHRTEWNGKYEGREWSESSCPRECNCCLRVFSVDYDDFELKHAWSTW